MAQPLRPENPKTPKPQNPKTPTAWTINLSMLGHQILLNSFSMWIQCFWPQLTWLIKFIRWTNQIFSSLFVDSCTEQILFKSCSICCQSELSLTLCLYWFVVNMLFVHRWSSGFGFYLFTFTTRVFGSSKPAHWFVLFWSDERIV